MSKHPGLFDTYSGSMPDREEFKRFKNINQYMLIDDRVHQIHNVVVHLFRMGDVEDPDLYAAEPLIKWQCQYLCKWLRWSTGCGQFTLQHQQPIDGSF